MPKTFLFVRNALSLLFHKYENNPDRAAEIIFEQIQPSIDFVFADSQYGRDQDAICWRESFLKAFGRLITDEYTTDTQE